MQETESLRDDIKELRVEIRDLMTKIHTLEQGLAVLNQKMDPIHKIVMGGMGAVLIAILGAILVLVVPGATIK